MSFTLKQSTSSNRTVNYYTGLSPVQVLAINPTHEQLKTITGNDNIPEVLANYEIRENKFTQKDEMPLVFWFKTPEEAIFSFTVNISKQPVMSKNGKTKFINDYGKISSFVENIEAITENPKMKWYSTSTVKQLTQGEELLYTILKQLFRYDESEAGWLSQMQENHLTSEALFNGDKRAWVALNGFLALVVDNCVVVPLTVKESTTSEGNVRLRQEVLLNTDLIFRTVTCKVTDSMVDKFVQVDNEYQSRTGMNITKNYYTHTFQAFDREKCVGNAPSETVTPAAENHLSWLD